ncbi:DUF29 domain-containing protein [Mesorhizobium sp. LHD-90]|uniref:DUF29 domain-containing protein n=1 Tax=Mesorhizobium sp. LHD-90 TaxID=3071414 RepID=UPI0027E19826|nr:DUF29 domain-containing protein [Mesorhizobium sp. LHD-90]MDQ6435819.1 DUF29 domain-containing protein [Mesorhizobium sp. LHD-90]
MNKHLWKSQLTPYEVDFAQWCVEQGALLRAGRLDALDRENLAEEIESLGGSEEDEIGSRLNVLLTHLLKWRYQPDKRSSGWRGTIAEQRYRIGRRLKRSPSLRAFPAEVLVDEYKTARLLAAGKTGLPEQIFPETCPFVVDQILEESFFPDAAEER